MDLSKFNDDSFDVKDWINSAFKSPQAVQTEKKEQFASVLVTKLQFLIKEANKSLEDSSQQVVTNVTRVLRDVDAVKQEAALLKSQMEAVQEQIESVEHETQHSMQVLVELDRVKTRVESARGALEEANKWSTLVSAVEEKFSEGDVKSVADQIAAMKASLVILKNAPDYNEKNYHLESLKNRLETWLSSRVVECFNNQSQESADFLLDVFRKIDRESSFKNTYYSCRLALYVGNWNKLEKSGDKLAEFYSNMTIDCEKEEGWLTGLFTSDARDMSITLMAKVCNHVQHEIADMLKTTINSCDDDVEALDVLIKNCKHANKFVKSLKLGPEDSALIQPILKPYTTHLFNFGKMIQQKLYIQLNEVQIDDENFTDSLHKFQNSIEKIFQLMFQAFDICEDLTGGLAIESCLQASNNFLTKYAFKCSLFLDMMRKKWKAGAERDILSESDAWRAFSDSLQLITCTGDLVIALDDAEEQVGQKIVEVAERFFTNDGFIGVLAVPNTDRYNYLKTDQLQSLQSLSINTVAGLTQDSDEHNPGHYPLSIARTEFNKLNQNAIDLAYDIVVAQVRHQFRTIATKNIWADTSATEGIVNDMPAMGVIPQEYVTQVGEFILTLPQHLEPLSEVDEETAAVGLIKALSLGELKIVESDVCGGAEWLESLVKSTEKEMVDSYLNIPKLTDSAGVQLKADIDYMCNVTDSLGIEPLPVLLDVRTLATLERKFFYENVEECDKKVVNAIAKMRGINDK